jgi:hypothetical protein
MPGRAPTSQGSKAEIAILAKLDLLKTAAALRVLMRLGLARQDRTKAWHSTARAKTCCFGTVPDRPRQNSGVPGPGARRLLEVLDRPMRGREIAEKLGVTYQRVHQLTIRLHAQGRVTFGDPENPRRYPNRRLGATTLWAGTSSLYALRDHHGGEVLNPSMAGWFQ